MRKDDTDKKKREKKKHSSDRGVPSRHCAPTTSARKVMEELLSFPHTQTKEKQSPTTTRHAPTETRDQADVLKKITLTNGVKASVHWRVRVLGWRGESIRRDGAWLEHQ